MIHKITRKKVKPREVNVVMRRGSDEALSWEESCQRMLGTLVVDDEEDTCEQSQIRRRSEEAVEIGERCVVTMADLEEALGKMKKEKVPGWEGRYPF